MLSTIYSTPARLFRLLWSMTLFTTMSLCGSTQGPAAEPQDAIDCAAPPRGATLGQIAPCIQRRQSEVILWNGNTHKGKVSLLLEDPCPSEDGCSVLVRSRFRRRKFAPQDIAIVEYRPRLSPRRQMWVAIGGVATGVLATKWLIDEGAGSALGVYTFAVGAYMGVHGGYATALAVRPKPVTVRIIWP